MAEDKKEVATEQQQEPVANQNGDNKPTNGDAPLTNGSNGTAEETPANVEPVKEMRSIVLNAFGGPKSVKVLKRPEPAQPTEGEVLIRVQSA